MPNGNHIVIDPVAPNPVVPPAPAPAPVVPPVVPPAPAPQPLAPGDNVKLTVTLKLVAHLLQGASKLTKDFELDDRLADGFADLVAQSWFIDLVGQLLTQFKSSEVTEAQFHEFVAKVAAKKQGN